MGPLPTVSVAGVPVADAGRAAVVTTIASLVGTSTPRLVACVHVAGLLAREDQRFLRTLSSPDCLAYADGVSVEVLARIAGARHIERCPLTDAGHELLDQLAGGTRVVLIGGPEGLAERAATRLSSQHSIDVAMVTHGFHGSWDATVQQLHDVAPEVVFVGLGTPYEVLWYDEHRGALPPAVYLTAGGWFGHIVGDEQRAPRWARRVGLEWVYRMIQRPRDLVPRYGRGVVAILRLLPAAVGARRLRDRDRPGS